MAISHSVTPTAPIVRLVRRLTAALVARTRARAWRWVDTQLAVPRTPDARDPAGRFDPYSPEAMRVFRLPPWRI